ncbi:MAG: undecaprenyl-diphosphate phosphatase [Planctomycetota bacterium]
MQWWEAVILGVVEGLTEYLPVSSTGHLIVTQRALGLDGEAADAFAICIQAGAIVAVLGLYWKRVREAAVGWAGKIGVGPGSDDGFRLGLHLLIAFMPAAVLGPLLDDLIEQWLFNPTMVAVALFVGGVAIIVVDRWKRATATKKDDVLADGESADASGGNSGGGRALEQMTPLMAPGIGFLQCAAMWPGTSRSLMTIVGGVLVGLSLAAAVEFSFLLGVITLLAATLYRALLDSVVVELPSGGEEEVMMLFWMQREYGWMPMIVGSVAAWGSAVLAVRWMVGYLKSHGIAVFGYYRVVAAAAIGVLIAVGFFAE